MQTKRKNGETAKRIYSLLKRNPDLTTNQIATCLNDLSPGAVQTTVSRMLKRGEVEVRGKKLQRGPTGRVIPQNTYHVKYKVRPALTLKKKPPKPQPTPKVEAPKPQPTPKVEAPKPEWKPLPITPEPEGPTTPTAEREVMMLRHLGNIYKSMNLMTEQQEALIEVLKGTLADLAETKKELEEAQARRNWWDKVKELFS